MLLSRSRPSSSSSSAGRRRGGVPPARIDRNDVLGSCATRASRRPRSAAPRRLGKRVPSHTPSLRCRRRSLSETPGHGAPHPSAAYLSARASLAWSPDLPHRGPFRWAIHTIGEQHHIAPSWTHRNGHLLFLPSLTPSPTQEPLVAFHHFSKNSRDSRERLRCMSPVCLSHVRYISSALPDL